MDDKNVIERVVRLEADVRNAQEGNRVFRDEIRQEIKEIHKQNKAIYEIATSVKLIAQDLQGLKSDVKEVKDDQKSLHKRMDKELDSVRQKQGQIKDTIYSVDSKDANKVLKIWEGVRDKLI